MKKIFTLLFFFITSLNLSAQWSDEDNQFYDSLHMPVCTVAGDQVNARVIQSYPDSGYFVIWEHHNYYDPTKIFAQKFDKAGNQLWAKDGIAISSGTNSQHYTYSTSYDLRNYSVAATDSAGGLYIGYADDSVSNYVWERLMVQHIRNDGSLVFPGAGAILCTSEVANQNLAPQLVADGNGGFFISFLKGGYGTMHLYVYCYKDENGILKNYGGGPVSENGFTKINTGYCGNYSTVEYYQTYVLDYKIYPDLQKGCNVVMTFSQNGGLGNERTQTAFNWLWRVKKNSTTDKATFLKDDVKIFYNLNIETGNLICKNDVTNEVYTYLTTKLLSNGFMPVSDWVYGAERTKGTMVPTDGNINVNIVAVNQRDVNNNQLSDWFTRIYYRVQQKFDSIPYEYTTDTYLPSSIFGIAIPDQNILSTYSNKNNDTLLYNAGSNYFYDFSLASGGNKIFATCIVNGAPRSVLLQQLSVEKLMAGSYEVRLKTASPNGIRIGKEMSTGFGGTSIFYNNPQVAADQNGNGVFYILETGRSTRVSPIGDGAELLWGAMGKPTGTGHFNGQYYTPDNPVVHFDPLGGTGVLAWNDSRHPPVTLNNIFMRHLDHLNASGNYPPDHLVKKLVNPYGATTADPTVLLGASKKYSTIEAYSGYSGTDVTTPVMAILDDYNLGALAVSVFENNGPIRTYKGQPYLDRNFTITPENNPAGAATIHVRLYFTQEEFDALKAADPAITSPADLAVIKQPGTGSAPSSFIFVAGGETIYPQSWAAVPGGYYLEIDINSFSNFFIQRANGSLPLQWLNVQAQWIDHANAKVSWQVADEKNVKKYNVQYSADGISFQNVCEVTATLAENYNCIVPVEKNPTHYFRVLQTDVDGKSSFSKVVNLKRSEQSLLVAYPNPAKDKLYLNGLPQAKYSIEIFNANGKLIMKQGDMSGKRFIEISSLSAGVYSLSVKTNGEVHTIQFIKQ